jgi:pyruvate dehydrogenase E1 component beta subunit
MEDAMAADAKVLAMGEDIGRLGGVFRATDGLFAKFGPRRVMDTPIAESGIVGTAIGLAMRGYRPVVEIQFDAFVYPAFDQIVSQLAKYHSRSGGRTQMPVTIRIPYGGGIGAVEHHSESPEVLFAHTPGLRVVTPSTPADAYTLLRWAIASPDPVIFLEPKARYWDTGAVAPRPGPWAGEGSAWDGLTAASECGPIRARTVRTGNLVTVATYGPAVAPALRAAATHSAAGRAIEVIDLRSLAPLDVCSVAESVDRTGRLVVVHEAPVFAGLGAELAAAIAERCFYRLEAPVLRVGGLPMPYPPAKTEHAYLPTPERIATAISQTLEY